VLAQLLDVGDEVPRWCCREVGVRRRTPGDALVEQDDPVGAGLVETAASSRRSRRPGRRAASPPACLRVAALLVEDPVAAVDGQLPLS
jgi:hypothetical protein